MARTFNHFVLYHRQQVDAGHESRLGQRFVNMYVKGQWPELFYCTDDKRSAQMIEKYLRDLQYWPCLPSQGLNPTIPEPVTFTD